MLKMSKVETKTQEVTLLLTVVSAISLLLTGVFFLFLGREDLSALTGDWGSVFLEYVFATIGYAAFATCISIFLLGRFLILRAHTPHEILESYSTFVYHLSLQICVVCTISALLAVFEAYYQFDINPVLPSGAGGIMGVLVGGTLFKLFGLFGSLSILGTFIMVTGIISGYVELVRLTLWTKEQIQESGKKTFFSVRNFVVGVERLIERLLKRQGLDLDKVREFVHRIRVINVEDLNDDERAFLEGQVVVDESARGTGVARESFASHQVNLMRPKAEIFREGAGPLARTQKIKRRRKVKVYSEDKDDLSALEVQVEELETPPTPAKTRSRKKRRKKATTAVQPDPVPIEDIPAIDEADSETVDSKELDIQVKRYSKRYQKPDLSILKKAKKSAKTSKTDLEQQSRNIEERLESFQLKGKVISATLGDRLTMFEFQPNAGVKLSKIVSLTDDLALVLGADAIRIMAPIPGKTTVGIEVPNKTPSMVTMAELMKDVQKAAKTSELPIALGKNVYNEVVVEDIDRMPHLLVSGTTGSGKSVFINTLICSLLYSKSPKELRFLMVDPKMIELSPYNGIPHLLRPVVTDVVEAKDLLVWAEREMDRRYIQFAQVGARNIQSFNEKIKNSTKKDYERRMKRKFDWDWIEMPQIVVVIDELADLMITQGKEVEIPITRIAQKARSAGLHLIIATQRPSSEIVTGLIKTNFPTRIAFKVSSAIDSRTILDTSGAEKLLGNGDMLYMPNGKSIIRLQGSFISEPEVKKIVDNISEE